MILVLNLKIDFLYSVELMKDHSVILGHFAFFPGLSHRQKRFRSFIIFFFFSLQPTTIKSHALRYTLEICISPAFVLWPIVS